MLFWPRNTSPRVNIQTSQARSALSTSGLYFSVQNNKQLVLYNEYHTNGDLLLFAVTVLVPIITASNVVSGMNITQMKICYYLNNSFGTYNQLHQMLYQVWISHKWRSVIIWITVAVPIINCIKCCIRYEYHTNEDLLLFE